MKKILLLMGMAALFMMACSFGKKTEERAKSFYEQRDSLYNDADEDVKCENWGVKEWLNFQKTDMRIAIAFYESNPSVEDVYSFVMNRKSFINRIDDGFYQVNKKAYDATTIFNVLVLNKKDFVNDSEALKLLDKLVRAQSSWMNTHGKEYNHYKEVLERRMRGEVINEEEYDIEDEIGPAVEQVLLEDLVNTEGPSEEEFSRWCELLPALKEEGILIYVRSEW